MIGYLTPRDYWWGIPPVLDIAPSSDTRTRTRRISRSPTLDGGAVVNDGGYSESDRTITLGLRNVSRADAAALEIIAAFAPCRLSLDHGLYEGYVQSHSLTGATSRLVFWVYQRIA
ncbi:MAG: hypothetical protein EOM26_11265 [Alphaproteobacteria bacterium]|nr:hypothetical protein [Alphaproteobacteria bacterium]